MWLQAAHECKLMAVLVDLMGRAIEQADASVTLDTLEGVTYLMQRMQVRLSSEGIMTPHDSPSATEALVQLTPCVLQVIVVFANAANHCRPVCRPSKRRLWGSRRK